MKKLFIAVLLASVLVGGVALAQNTTINNSQLLQQILDFLRIHPDFLRLLMVLINRNTIPSTSTSPLPPDCTSSMGYSPTTGVRCAAQNLGIPINPIPLPDMSGYKKSLTGRFITTDIVVDTDTTTVSDGELIEFLRIANDILVDRTDTEIKLGKIKRVSYGMLLPSVCPDCQAGTRGTTVDILYGVYKNEPEPEFVVFLRADNFSSTYGGWSASLQSRNSSYHNRFKSADGSSNRIYISFQDWNHKYGTCGYDYSDPRNPRHISNASVDGECRNTQGTACLLKNNYYQCGDSLTQSSFYGTGPHNFVGANAVHELMHQFGSDGNYDHYGVGKCSVPSTDFSQFLNDAQKYAGICPTVFDVFRSSFYP